MTAKLTLSVDDKVIGLAKEIAQKKGKSISKIFEDYIIILGRQDEDSESIVDAITKRLHGKNKIPIPDDLDYRQFIRDARFEDYQNRKD